MLTVYFHWFVQRKKFKRLKTFVKKLKEESFRNLLCSFYRSFCLSHINKGLHIWQSLLMHNNANYTLCLVMSIFSLVAPKGSPYFRNVITDRASFFRWHDYTGHLTKRERERVGYLTPMANCFILMSHVEIYILCVDRTIRSEYAHR